MNFLIAEGISKSYGDRVLFDNISLNIEKGQKVALVAKNGAGKTSLLNILTGKDKPDTGRIILSKDMHMGFLPQEPELNEESTVIDSILSTDNILLAAVRAYEIALEMHAEDPSEKNETAMQDAVNKIDSLKAWDYETRINTILTKLEIHHLNLKIKQLSGGQKKRVALAKILVEEPDFMIMDEPTNHLDVEMIEWLEDYIARQRITLLLVTHDRYFLDRITNEILELDNKTMYKYTGTYASYIEKKAGREFHAARDVDTARNLMRKELEWMQRQPKARGTKQKARIDSFYDLKDRASQGVQKTELNMNIRMERLGGKIMEFKQVSKSYGEKVILKQFSYIFQRKERVGIVGPNGIGKSTFLNMIAGLEEPDKGKMVPGETIVIGYYTQKGMKIPESKRVLEVVTDIADFIPTAKGESISASKLLQHFGFEPAQQHTFVSKLSGGERRRLYLLTILMKNPNFLILDEPTNDLDINTLNTLEDFLESFGGCLIIVSHDRYFMDKLVDHLLIFEGDGKIKDFNGNYTDYKEQKELDEQEAKDKQKAVKEAPVEVKKKEEAPAAKRKMSFNEKREYDQIQKEIAAHEAKKAELENLLASGGGQKEDYKTWSDELQSVNNQIDSKTLRWLELEEMM